MTTPLLRAVITCSIVAVAFAQIAYEMRDFLVENAPDWLNRSRSDINAKAQGDFPAATIDGPDPRRDMLRALLAESIRTARRSSRRCRNSWGYGWIPFEGMSRCS